MRKSAYLSDDRIHRYWLWRKWDDSLPPLVVIGLNPSTADENNDDPTIRRCIAFAKREGCGSLLMLNLFSFRATSPKALKQKNSFELSDDGLNSKIVRREVGDAVSHGGKILCAWGSHGELHGYGSWFKIFLGNHYDLWCLGHTTTGQPKHPLYIRSDQPLERWTPWRFEK